MGVAPGLPVVSLGTARRAEHGRLVALKRGSAVRTDVRYTNLSSARVALAYPGSYSDSDTGIAKARRWFLDWRAALTLPQRLERLTCGAFQFTLDASFRPNRRPLCLNRRRTLARVCFLCREATRARAEPPLVLAALGRTRERQSAVLAMKHGLYCAAFRCTTSPPASSDSGSKPAVLAMSSVCCGPMPDCRAAISIMEIMLF